MTEIKKITKIALLWYGVAGLLFAFFYLVLTDFFAWQLMQWIYNDPVPFWSMGGTMLVFGIGSLIAYFKKKEWEEIKLFFLVTIMWVIASLIMDIFIVALLNLPETPMMHMIVNIILLTFNLVIGIFSWMKQRSSI